MFESFSIPFHFSFINYASFQSSCPLIFFLDVWAFDSDAVKALKDMKPMDMEKLVAKYSILLDPDSELLPQNRPNTLVGATCICQLDDPSDTQFSLIWHIHLQHEAIYFFLSTSIINFFSRLFKNKLGLWVLKSNKVKRNYLISSTILFLIHL